MCFTNIFAFSRIILRLFAVMDGDGNGAHIWTRPNSLSRNDVLPKSQINTKTVICHNVSSLSQLTIVKIN